MFRLVQSRDETTWNNKSLSVSKIGRKVVDDIDKNPTVGLLVTIKLCTIEGQLE
jgi:hypothetical protein